MIGDSCVELYIDKNFVKLATAGRHKSINVIYIPRPLSAEQVVFFERLEHNKYHLFQINLR